jgi:hypothetical protein
MSSGVNVLAPPKNVPQCRTVPVVTAGAARDCAAAGISWKASRRIIALRLAAAHLTIQRSPLCVVGVRFIDFSPESVWNSATTAPAHQPRGREPRIRRVHPRADSRQTHNYGAATTPDHARHADARIGIDLAKLSWKNNQRGWRRYQSRLCWLSS